MSQSFFTPEELDELYAICEDKQPMDIYTPPSLLYLSEFCAEKITETIRACDHFLDNIYVNARVALAISPSRVLNTLSKPSSFATAMPSENLCQFVHRTYGGVVETPGVEDKQTYVTLFTAGSGVLNDHIDLLAETRAGKASTTISFHGENISISWRSGDTMEIRFDPPMSVVHHGCAYGLISYTMHWSSNTVYQSIDMRDQFDNIVQMTRNDLKHSS